MDANFAFTKFTGEASTFSFPSPTVGKLSGAETFFWTNASECNDVTLSDVVGGNFSTTDANSVTSIVTLRNLQPGVYHICYEVTGQPDAAYNYNQNVKLNVSGKCLCCCKATFMFVVCMCMYACTCVCREGVSV